MLRCLSKPFAERLGETAVQLCGTDAAKRTNEIGGAHHAASPSTGAGSVGVDLAANEKGELKWPTAWI